MEKLGRQCPLSKLWPLPLEWSPHCTEMAVIAVADCPQCEFLLRWLLTGQGEWVTYLGLPESFESRPE